MSLIRELFNKKKQRQNEKEQEDIGSLELKEEDTEEDEDMEEDLEVSPEIKNEVVSDIPDSEIVYEVVEREIHPAKIICPDCGGVTLEGLEFCDKCGGELL